MVAMESTERAAEACCDFIVDLTSPLLLCRCGYPKKEHVESPENKRRTLTKVPSLTTLFADAPTPEPPSPSRPQACDGFMIDLLGGFGLCRCGHPKGAHGNSEDGSPPKRSSISQESSAVRALRQSFSSKADANAPLSMLEGRRSRKSVGTVSSALDRFESFAKGHEAQRAEDEERTQRADRVGKARHRCQTAPAAVIEAGVQVALRASEDDACTRDGPELGTSASASSCSDEAAVVDNGDAVKAARAKWAQAGEEAAERAAAEKTVAEERRLKEADAAAAARRREEKQVALKLAEERMAEEREQKALEEKHAAKKEAEERQAAEKLAEEAKSVEEAAPPRPEEKEECAIVPQPSEDITAVVTAGVVKAARAKWTQAAQEAEEKAAAERAEMEERAAARRAKEVDAAAAARRREEKQAAAEQAKEQKALEKALEKEQKALEEKQAAAVFLFAEQKQSEEQKALDEEAAQEAKKQVAVRIAHIEQQNQKRLGKILQREEEALRKAEMRENEEREKAARVAALRTQTVTCAGGGELMVTPEELQTLAKYVPNWAESTSGDLAELLPQLHMGAWLQGTKQLFANTASANARPRSNTVPNLPGNIACPLSRPI